MENIMVLFSFSFFFISVLYTVQFQLKSQCIFQTFLLIIQVNEYMKKQVHLFSDESQTIQCTNKCQLVPQKFITQDNFMPSIFLKKAPRKLKFNDPHELNDIKSEGVNNSIKQFSALNHSLLIPKNMGEINPLEGVLKTRKSQMKKIKLKQFYLSEIGQINEEKQSQSENQLKFSFRHQRNESNLNNLQQKCTEIIHNNLLIFNRKKILPVKLRAKSYTNFPKNRTNNFSYAHDDQKSLYIKPNCNMSFRLEQKSATIQYEQKSSRENNQRTLRSSKLKNANRIQQGSIRVLQDASSQLNKILMDHPMENNKKERGQRPKKWRKNSKNHQPLTIDQNFDLNPWNNSNNQEDKQNDCFHCY